jgi:hypothetical protein
MLKRIWIAAVLLLPLMCVSAQTVENPAVNDDAETRDKQINDLLRDTANEVQGLRLAENRISFSSELASLLWFRDEREARSMYAGVVNDFRQLVSQLDVQMNSLAVKPGDEPESIGPMFMGEPSERQKALRKFQVAIGVRQTIALSMADHDPDLALGFFYDSFSGVSNPDLQKQIAISDKNLEQQLFTMLAAADPDKAAQYAKKSLDIGFNSGQVDLLRKVFAKDPEKGADLASSILSRVKSENPMSLDLDAVAALLKYGTESYDKSRTPNGTKAVYTDSELRDIAEAFAQAVLARPSDSGIPFANYARQVERFQPGRAMQIRSKIQTRPTVRAPGRAGTLTAVRGGQVPTVGSASGPGVPNAADLARQQREQSEKKTMADIAKVASDKLNKEQRDKLIQQSRSSIMAMPGRDKRLAGLTALAAQVAKTGDKELADELMRDAASQVNPQPKNYQDYMLTWTLAAGYATVDPDKAFPILDDLIGRVNDLIFSSVRIVEFIDVSEEMVTDGEFQVGAFGGSMVRSLTTGLVMADSTVKLLAKSDFQKTCALAERFDRPEVRVLAQMIVLRAVLEKKSSQKPGVTDSVK